jgi:hypothetical protein
MRAKKTAATSGSAIREPRTLWKANLRVGTAKHDFLFRCGEEFSEASLLAEDLLQTSESTRIFGAVIVGIERVATLRN